MKCEYLIQISIIPERKGYVAGIVGQLPSDLLACIGKVNECPKKKQACEINARCWRIGGK